jgi:hypothetical protein
MSSFVGLSLWQFVGHGRDDKAQRNVIPDTSCPFSLGCDPESKKSSRSDNNLHPQNTTILINQIIFLTFANYYK